VGFKLVDFVVYSFLLENASPRTLDVKDKQFAGHNERNTWTRDALM
jgi:hypothetical protein